MLTKQQKIQCLVFFLFSLIASVTPAINTSEYSNDFTILIMSSISSLEMNKVKRFPALTAPFLSKLFITFEAAFEDILLTNFILQSVYRKQKE